MIDVSIPSLAAGTLSVGDLLIFAAALIAAGGCAGLIAGFLGVGGGIVMVPALFFVFGAVGVSPDLRIHLAVGTSMGTMIATSCRSFLAHRRAGAADLEILRSWAIAAALGAAGGGLASRYIDARGLVAIFGVLALGIAALTLIRGEAPALRPSLPGGFLNRLAAAAMGFFSALMGIGGGTFSIAYLTMHGVSIHRAVGTSSGLGLLISVPATFGFIVAGWDAVDPPPGSLGYVNAIGCLALIPTATLAAPFGAALSHRVERRFLSRFFALFLAIVAIRMLTTI